MVKTIARLLEGAAQALKLPAAAFDVKLSPRPEHGDFSTNMALLASRQAKRSPLAIAEELVGYLNGQTDLFVAKAAPGGFVNFFITPTGYAKALAPLWDGAKAAAANGKAADVEFVSANPTGKLHIGTARNAAIGDSLARVLAHAGWKVEREYYVNDGGVQIGLLVQSVRARMDELATGEPAKIPEGGYHGTDLVEVAKRLRGHPENDLRPAVVKALLDVIKSDLAKFGVRHDTWFNESSLYENEAAAIKGVLARLRKNGKLYEQDGATFLKTTPDGDDKDRVVVKSDGTYSYVTPDIAYHDHKMAKGYDLYVDVLGADHFSYVTRIKSAMKSLGHDSEKLRAIVMQLVSMVDADGNEFKMSKRAGGSLTMEDLIDAVGLDAARWFMVQKSPHTHLELNVAKALAKDDSNPVFYVQYAHARCSQVLAKGKDAGLTPARSLVAVANDSERALLSSLADFYNVLDDVVDALEPHRLANYLHELAKRFHAFYAGTRVVDAEDASTSGSRLAVVDAARNVLAEGLSLLGVSAPDRM